MWARLGGVHVVGWVLSILSTAAIAEATQVSLMAASWRTAKLELDMQASPQYV